MRSFNVTIDQNVIEFVSAGTALTSSIKIDGELQQYVQSMTITASVDEPIRVTVVYNFPQVDATLKEMKVVYEGEA